MANSYFYSNTAVQTTLSGNISAGATSFTVAATTGFPPSVPYILALDYGAATEELVKVTSAAGTTLTVERGFSGTSAQSHSIGAVIRHVVNAQDLTDFRTHEASTGAVHGLTGSIVGTSDTQTLSNKTLTSPTINAGALSGTFTGSPTFSGAPTFSGNIQLTGLPQHVRASAATAAEEYYVSGQANPMLQIRTDGRLSWGPGGASAVDTVLYREAADILATEDIFRVIRGSASNNAFSARVLGDPNSRWFMNADGGQNWGPGSAGTDTNLYRSAADLLKTDSSFYVGGHLTVDGRGEDLFVRKTADTSRASTTSQAADPELTLSLATNATYRMECVVIYSGTTAGDINIDFSPPAGAAGFWQGTGYGRGATDSVDGYTIRMNTNDVDAARTYGATPGVNNAVVCTGLVRTGGTGGTYTMDWAQAASDGTPTTVRADSYLYLRRLV